MGVREEREKVDCFVKKHKKDFSEIVNKAFWTYSEEVFSDVKHRKDFGAFVSFPLVIVGICWGITVKSNVSAYFIAGVLVAFGFLLSWYVKHIVKLACLIPFQERKQKIITEYLNTHIADRLDSFENQKNATSFYDRCYLEFFRVSVDINWKPLKEVKQIKDV
jgi:hypothetical protein